MSDPTRNNDTKENHQKNFPSDTTSQLQRRNELLDAINHILIETNNCESLDEVASLGLSVIINVLECEHGILAQFQEKKKIRILAQSSQKFPDSFLEKTSQPMIYQVTTPIKPVRNESVSIIYDKLAEITPKKISSAAPLILTHFIGIPLKRSGKLFGFFAFADDKREFDGHDVEDIQNLTVPFMEAFERKLSEIALKKSEERYRNLVLQSSQGIVVIKGPEPAFIFANPSISKSLGFSNEELLGLSPEEIIGLVDPEQREDFFGRFRRSLQGENVSPYYLVRALHKDGTYRYLEMFARRIEYEGETAIQATFIDVTSKKLTEERIQRREKEYRFLLETIPEGLMVVGLDESIIFANRTICKMLQYDPEELVKKKITDLVPSKELPLLITETLRRRKKKISTYEMEMIRKDEEIRIFRISAVPAKDADGKVNGTIAVCIDVTERKRMEDLAEQRRRESELYASLLRHDVGNDLQVVLGYIEAIQMFSSDISGTANEMIESALAAAERMTQLVKSFDRMDKEVQSNIIKLIQGVTSQAEKAHRGLKVKIEVKEKNEHLRVAGGSLLPMAFENILRNSAQYCGEKPEVTIGVSREGDYVIITISDNGPGIPEEIRPRLFSRGTSTSGGGLGLYLTRQIIWACGGKIHLNDSSEGAVFRIKLPLLF
ncbi:MAG: putative Histidine kinase [Candidatus Thorarchaeota archaeon]|nr:MAG: putative Histidine kinase [Candidatus Thorarchaeota archaeon]